MGRGMKSQQGLTTEQIDKEMFGGWVKAAQDHYQGQQQGQQQGQGDSTTQQQS